MRRAIATMALAAPPLRRLLLRQLPPRLAVAGSAAVRPLGTRTTSGGPSEGSADAEPQGRRAAKQSDIDPERIRRLRTTFARASVAARLLQSRLALPISYPLNADMLREANKANPGQALPRLPPTGDELKDQGWQDNEIWRGLAHVTPLVVGMAKVAPLLKAAQALSHYQGGLKRHVAPDPATVEEEDDIRLNHIRPQRWKGRNSGHVSDGSIVSKVGGTLGWEEYSSGRTVDARSRAYTVDPFDDTPRLHHVLGRKFVSKTTWDKRKSGSQ